MAPPHEHRRTHHAERDDETVEELARDAEERNEDPTTRREALELDLEDRDRSDEGIEVGDEID